MLTPIGLISLALAAPLIATGIYAAKSGVNSGEEFYIKVYNDLKNVEELLSEVMDNLIEIAKTEEKS